MQSHISHSYKNKSCKTKLNQNHLLKTTRFEEKSKCLNSGKLKKIPDLKEIMKEQKERSSMKSSKNIGSTKCSSSLAINLLLSLETKGLKRKLPPESTASETLQNEERLPRKLLKPEISTKSSRVFSKNIGSTKCSSSLAVNMPLSLETKSLKRKLPPESTASETILQNEERLPRKLLNPEISTKSSRIISNESPFNEITQIRQYNSHCKCPKSSVCKKCSGKKPFMQSPVKREKVKPTKDQCTKVKDCERIIGKKVPSCIRKRKKKLRFEPKSEKQLENRVNTSSSNKGIKCKSLVEIQYSKYSCSPSKNESKDETKSECNLAIYPMEQKMDIDDIEDINYMQRNLDDNNWIREEIIVVVDTNVLLREKSVLNNLRSTMFFGKTMKIIIPFMVLQELDRLKTSQGKKMALEAQAAIKWCNAYLENEDPCIQGQDYKLYLDSLDFGGKNNDDSILGCCLLFCQKGKIVYLISDDVNLRNKALSFKIKSINSKKLQTLMQQRGRGNSSLLNFKESSDNSLINEVSSSKSDRERASSLALNNTDKVVDIKIDLKINLDIEASIIKCLGGVLEYAMKDAYDDLWESIVLYKPPWSAVQVLKCFEKHWIALFMDKFSDDIKTIIKKIHQALENPNKVDIQEKLLFLYGLFVDEPYKSIVNAHSYPGCHRGQVKTLCPILEPQNCIFGDLLSNFDHIQQTILDVGKHANFILKEMTNSLSGYRTDEMGNSGPYFSKVGQSLQVLRTTLISFGYLLLSLKDGNYNIPVTTVNQQLNNYWELAQQKRPPINLSEDQLKSFSASVEGKEFIQLCLADFEKLIQIIDTMVSS